MATVPIITGLGLVTPLGDSVEQTWSALLAGEHIVHHARTRTHASAPDRIHPLALSAAGQALAEAGWLNRQGVWSNPPAGGSQGPPAGGAAVVVGTSKGAVETWMTAPPGPAQACGLASIAGALRKSHPALDGPALTVSSACASGLHALIRAAMMIRFGEARRVLVVAAEASVHPLFLASFTRLGVLPREGVGCRPFDEQREGFLMSEAAAAICLEAGDSDARPRGYASVDRFALGGDATHLTAGDEAGRTLRRLLQMVVDGRGVDLLHAHGTGTTFNDPLELSAVSDHCVIGPAVPIVYSHKGALGHSLGAAGLVSIVLNCVSHRRGIVPGNVQTRHPLRAPRVRLCCEPQQAAVKRSIALAAGFGGPVAVVALSSM